MPTSDLREFAPNMAPALIGHPTITVLDLQARLVDAGGFCWDPVSERLYEVGSADAYAIAVQGTEVPVTAGELGAALDWLYHRHQVGFIVGELLLGGWMGPDGPMVEVVEIHRGITREEAIGLGRERFQLAIFDIATGEEITL